MKQTFRTVLAAAALASLALGASAASAAGMGTESFHTVRSEAAAAPLLLAQRHDRRHEVRGCAPRQALRKAQRLGLHRPAIVRDNRRVVVVDGRKRGHVVTVRFAQTRGCPILRVR